MMDLVLEAWVAALIEQTRLEWMLGAGRKWKPGDRLKLLFAGYNGTRNTGSDVRVEEMLRQVRRVLGANNVDLTVMTFNFERIAGLLWRHGAGASDRNIFPPVPLPSRGAASSRRYRVRRVHVQEQVRERADHDDDRLAGHRRRRK